MITPASPHRGIYFDGQWFFIASYSSKESNDYIGRLLGLPYLLLGSFLAQQIVCLDDDVVEMMVYSFIVPIARSQLVLLVVDTKIINEYV